MRKNYYFVCAFFILSVSMNAQDQGFYVQGYLLYNKDSTPCRIWYNPDTPNYRSHITVWLNEQASEITWANKEIPLSGFWITQPGYQVHYGKIRIRTVSSEIYTYAKKVVTGTVELYEAPVFLVRKANDSYKLEYLTVSDYYIGRSDTRSFVFPTLLNPIKKKKLIPFLTDFPEEKIKDKMTPEQLVDLLNEYNQSYKQASTTL